MTLATLSRHQWTSADYERLISASASSSLDFGVESLQFHPLVTRSFQ